MKNIHLEYQKLIEKYFDEGLTSKEEELFKVYLKDKIFKQEYFKQLALWETLIEKEEMKLKNELKDFDLNLVDKEAQVIINRLAKNSENKNTIEKLYLQSSPKPKKSAKMFNLLFWVASTAAVGLIIAILFILPNHQKSLEAKINIEPYPNVIYPIVASENSNDLKKLALKSYEMKNYDRAIDYFSQIPDHQINDDINFYLAISYLLTDQTKLAIPLLEGIIKNKGLLEGQARWYLALAYYTIQELNKAEKILQVIVKMDSFKAYQAEELLNLINHNF